MAVISTTNETLLDVARRTDPDGVVPQIVELLEKENEILQDMSFKEANMGETNKTTIRTGLPSVYWRRYNMGVPKSKSTSAVIVDHCAMLEGRSEIDVDEVEINTNPKQFRFDEDMAFLSAMNNKMAGTVFYGDLNTPESFVGLAARYSKPSKTDTEAGFNIIDTGAGNVGAKNTSIWLCGWGERTGYGIYPRGSKAGFTHEDRGIQTVYDTTEGRNPYDAYVSVYKWKNGLTIRDWRYFGRICNIDTTNLTGESAADLVEKMIRLSAKIPTNKAGVRFAFYARKEIWTALRLQILNKRNVQLSFDNVDGKPVMNLDGIPVRRCDAIRADEAKITGQFAEF